MALVLLWNIQTPNTIFGTVADHSPVVCQRVLCCDCFNILSLQTINVQIDCQITLIYQLILPQMNCGKSPYIYS